MTLYPVRRDYGMNQSLGFPSPGQTVMQQLTRRMPSLPASPILAYVDKNRFTVDQGGAPFPAGTLWVTSQSQSMNASGSVTADDTWIPVPQTLPVGYTFCPQRNIGRAATQMARFVPGTTSGPGPIRSANGLWWPSDLDGLTTWGPVAVRDVVDIGATSSGSTSAMSAATAFSLSRFSSWHPGYRAIRVLFQLSPFNFAFAPYTQRLIVWESDQSAATSLYDVSASTGLFAFNGTSGFYEYDTGTITLPPLPTGRVRRLTIDTYSTCANPSYGSGSFTWRLSPRVDIPFCLTATSGAPADPNGLVAPGGVLTGSIAGF